MESSAVRTRHRRRREHSSRSRGFAWIDAADWAQGGLILLMMVAAPWLFGVTEPWSISTMNLGSLAVGLLGLGLWISDRSAASPEVTSRERLLRRSFLAVNLILLAFCAISFFNARALFHDAQQSFTYRSGVISWLPTSYDSKRTQQFLVNTVAFFCVFWGARQWVCRGRVHRSDGAEQRMPFRLKLISWVFVVNGFLVALQGLLQRLSGSTKLLWFRQSYWSEAAANFGPFSYRGNAVDYLNMVWPVTFGFWYYITHRRNQPSRGFGDGPELLLLPMFLVTLAASFSTLSRGGVIVATVLLLGLGAILVSSKTARVWRWVLPIALALVFAFTIGLFGRTLMERFRAAFTDNLSGRTEIYHNAQQIAADFPWFGSGPGTFMSIYFLYRQDPKEDWAAFLHDDWLETRVTFGRVGFGLILLQFALLAGWVLAARERWISPVLSFCLGLSLLGCLAHAKGDFPFQTYGIVFTFVMVSALLTSATDRQIPHIGNASGAARPA